jgi:hypothetical protein
VKPFKKFVVLKALRIFQKYGFLKMFFKKGEELHLPECFKSWLSAKLPELRGFKNIRFFISEKLPFDWLPADRSSIIGITFWNKVYLRKSDFLKAELTDKNFVRLIIHELVHVGQFFKNPARFPFQYLYHYAKIGYKNMPEEIEAREGAERLLAEFVKEDPCRIFKNRDTR